MEAIGIDVNKFLENIKLARKSIGNVDSFTKKFNKKRCTLLNNCEEMKDNTSGVLYWIQRDCRVQDNWALIFAQRMALKAKLPLHVAFFGEPNKDYYPSTRQYKFLLEGLRGVQKELQDLNINFYLINASPSGLTEIIKKNNIGALVCDFNPLRYHRKAINTIKTDLPEYIPFIEVDAHNIVPCLIASEKQEIAARTIRFKINGKLEDFCDEFPEVCKHPFDGKLLKIETSEFDTILEMNLPKIHQVPDVDWAKPGYSAGMAILHDFLRNKLNQYADSRNEPSLNLQSNLSPWLHFGQISAQRVALETKKTGKNKNVESFLEELIVRRELADNYCYYNSNYDNFKGADKWAQITLEAHKNDKRKYIYDLDQFINAKTHDPIWNAAQIQLNSEGKLHGYMRMYWCKKILEWTTSPEEAIKFGLYLNDTYSLDGSDPNGMVGVMWSICGVHDHGWKEREIFGKIRFMVDYSLEKKYDIKTYCNKYLKGVRTENEIDAKQKKTVGALKRKRK